MPREVLQRTLVMSVDSCAQVLELCTATDAHSAPSAAAVPVSDTAEVSLLGPLTCRSASA